MPAVAEASVEVPVPPVEALAAADKTSVVSPRHPNTIVNTAALRPSLQRPWDALGDGSEGLIVYNGTAWVAV